MFLRLETLQQKTLVGKHLTMSLTNIRTAELWRSFMPIRSTIKNTKGTELYSVEVYNPHYFSNFNPSQEFEKWAAVEVADANEFPTEMEMFIIPTGLYAVFLHKGPASEGPRTYGYIFQNWLPASGYLLDNRPHFAVMGEKYKNDSADSEEEIWVPVRIKT